MRTNLTTPACGAALAATTFLTADPSPAAPVPHGRTRFAADTLALVRKGGISAARARAKDLETAWDGPKPA